MFDTLRKLYGAGIIFFWRTVEYPIVIGLPNPILWIGLLPEYGYEYIVAILSTTYI